jgi:hypothetical protein
MKYAKSIPNSDGWFSIGNLMFGKLVKLKDRA